MINLVEIRTRVKTNISAQMAAASLTVYNLHDNSIEQWANEEVSNVMMLVKNPKRFATLQANDISITFSSGIANLPSDFFWINTKQEPDLLLDWVTLKVNTTNPAVTKRYAKLISMSEFARYDNSNFVLTADMTNPVAAIGQKIYIKPTTITQGYLTYITTHQGVNPAGTEFDDFCDNILIHLIMGRYYKFLELAELESNCLKIAAELANVA